MIALARKNEKIPFLILGISIGGLLVHIGGLKPHISIEPPEIVVDYGEITDGTVNSTKSLEIDGIQFHLKQEMPGDTTGKANIQDKTVWIETGGRTVKGFYSTCVHEVWGHIRSKYTHPTGGDDFNKEEWVDQIEDQVVLPTCLQLLHRINGSGGVEP